MKPLLFRGSLSLTVAILAQAVCQTMPSSAMSPLLMFVAFAIGWSRVCGEDELHITAPYDISVGAPPFSSTCHWLTWKKDVVTLIEASGILTSCKSRLRSQQRHISTFEGLLCDYKLLLVRQPSLFATIPSPFADAGDPLSFTPCEAIHLRTRFFIRQPSCTLVPGETWPWGGAERPETNLFKLATQSMYLFFLGSTDTVMIASQ